MFNDQTHKETFLSLCPGKLLTDSEWIGPIYILTSDNELRQKTKKCIDSAKRGIDWTKIFKTDFCSGHRAILHWAYALWAGEAWKWDSDGNKISPIDTFDISFYMEHEQKVTATYALMLRWKLQTVKI